MPKAARPKDPHAIAAAAVTEYVDVIATHRDINRVPTETIDESLIDAAIRKIVKVLKDQHGALSQHPDDRDLELLEHRLQSGVPGGRAQLGMATAGRCPISTEVQYPRSGGPHA